MSEHVIRLLIADDHAMLRDGLRRSLTSQGFEVIEEAANGQEAVERALESKPDVVLMDLTMPVLDGIKATQKLVERQPDAKVLVLTMHADATLIAGARAAGAMGYLVKDCRIEDIASAVTAAMNGQQTFTEPAPVEEPVPDKENRIITAREAEVLQMIADGRNTSEAAKELYVSVKTVKNHLASAYAKLDAHDRTQAVLKAARLGLIKLDGSD
jgi:DNA-binding NarL/FixJ family response regulator